jgi:hypothetical protein
VNVALVLRLRLDDADDGLAGWIEEVATGERVAVRGDGELVNALHRIVRTAEPQTEPSPTGETGVQPATSSAAS